jgi:tRNA G18 (ribose-2'-O)-methylase SpoU
VAEILVLDDTSDPRLACYTDLRWDANPPADSEWFVVEGRICVQRLIESPLELLSILVERGNEAEVASWVEGKTPVFSLPRECVRRLVGYNFHRGVLACGRRPRWKAVATLDLADCRPPIALAPVGVNQRENLGSMLRTAAALGIDNILVGPNTADPYSRRTVRVSMAAVLKQRLYELDQPVGQLRALQATGKVRTVVTTLSHDAKPLDQFNADDRGCILVMGSEAEGIDPQIEAIATDRVTIPMKLGTDSLNVSVAAAIFMYELISRYRQRG